MSWGRLEDTLKEKKIQFTPFADAKILSTFHIGGICRILIEPACEGELIDSICLCRALSLPFSVIGNGSNLLFDDGMILRAIIRTRLLDACRFDQRSATAEAGVSLPLLSRRAAAHGFRDLVFAAGIPASMGGAVMMNAGAYQKSVGESVDAVTVFDIEQCKKRTYFNNELTFSYRNSFFRQLNVVILRVSLLFSNKGDPTEIHEEIKAVTARRSKSQPCGIPSAGSTFLRPEPDVAISAIFDELGLKGMRVGGAAVSEKHAGFIVNTGGATASDVLCLIQKIQDITEKERGFRPKPEIRLITNET